MIREWNSFRGKQGLPSSGSKSASAGLGVRRCRRTIIAAIAGVVLLPVEATHADFFSNLFKTNANQDNPPKRAVPPPQDPSPKQDVPPKQDAPPKQEASPRQDDPPKPPASVPPVAAPKSDPAKPVPPAKTGAHPSAKPFATKCDLPKYRIIVDVGHTLESEGAMSARNVIEFNFNLGLGQLVADKLKAAGFAATRLLVTEGEAKSSLVKRVVAANNWPADFFLSIHHDSVPEKFLENWDVDGKPARFSDRFSGYSVFVSTENPEFKTSLEFAELLAKEMKTKGLEYAHQYSQAIMGAYQHPLLNKETGVYSYDHLIVLRSTRMPAVLLEAGSIINRDEELKMGSPERRDLISDNVVNAFKKFCDVR
jgi:N-acetylmuramoyl-L-alanine amidase